ncbi:hypothetical protein KEM52_004213, partial [Ascosphaera acerosa]
MLTEPRPATPKPQPRAAATSAGATAHQPSRGQADAHDDDDYAPAPAGQTPPHAEEEFNDGPWFPTNLKVDVLYGCTCSGMTERLIRELRYGNYSRSLAKFKDLLRRLSRADLEHLCDHHLVQFQQLLQLDYTDVDKEEFLLRIHTMARKEGSLVAIRNMFRQNGSKWFVAPEDLNEEEGEESISKRMRKLTGPSHDLEHSNWLNTFKGMSEDNFLLLANTIESSTKIERSDKSIILHNAYEWWTSASIPTIFGE